MKTRAKKIWAVLLSILLLAGLVPLVEVRQLMPTAQAAVSVWNGVYSSNDGNFTQSGNNYYIRSAQALAYFIYTIGTNRQSYSGSTVYLDVDVDMNSRELINAWGSTYDSQYFQGIFDGQNHTIYNLKVTSSDHRVGLFRSAENATFKNLVFYHPYAYCSGNKNGVGALVGYFRGSCSFEHIQSVDGTIQGYQEVGGIAGEGQGSRAVFKYCKNSSQVTASEARGGGILGYWNTDEYLEMQFCENTGVISIDKQAGGICGESKGRFDASNCVNSGAVTSANQDAGGIISKIQDDDSTIINCSNSGTIRGSAATGGIGGYFGDNSNNPTYTITRNENTGTVISSGGYAGGIVGEISSENLSSIQENINSGNVTGYDKTGGICGFYHGGGYCYNNTNKAANISSTSNDAGGIFGSLMNKMVEFRFCYNTAAVTGCGSVGGIVGYGYDGDCYHTFYRCFNYGNITCSGDYAGGLMGLKKKGTGTTFTECFNLGVIKSNKDTGGLEGHNYNHTVFERCFNRGAVSYYSSSACSKGGIIGHSGDNKDIVTMKDCFNTGAVSGGEYGGGLVGYVRSSDSNDQKYTVANSYNAGLVSGASDANASFIAHNGGPYTNDYYVDLLHTGVGQGTAVTLDELKSAEMPSNLSSNFVQDTWGVNNYYPVHSWWRDNYFRFPVTLISDGNVVTSGDYFYNMPLSAQKTTKAGYNFTGYYTEETGGTQVIGSNGGVITVGVTAPTDTQSLQLSAETAPYVYAQPVTFYAHFTPRHDVQYLVEHCLMNTDGTSYTVYETVSRSDGTADASKSHDALVKSYVGYIYDAAASGDETVIAADGSTVIKLYYTRYQYSVTLGTAEGVASVSGDGSHYHGESVTVSAELEEGYDFSGWISSDTGLVANSESQNYTFSMPMSDIELTPSAQRKHYSVTFMNGSTQLHCVDVLHGQTPVYSGATPTRPAGVENNYVFIGWTLADTEPDAADVYYTANTLPPATGDATYYAYFTSQTNVYTITWAYLGGSVIKVDSVAYGSTPAYSGPTPTKASNAQYSYVFNGWSPEITTVTSNKTYYAQFTPVQRSYTVTWANYDGSVLKQDSGILYGVTPTYVGDTPAREETAEYTFTFSGWSPNVTSVKGDVTYTAVFSAEKKKYTVSWKNYDGTFLETDEDVLYGTIPTYDGAVPTRAGDLNYSYTFSGWTPSVAEITGDTVYTANYSVSVRKYTITWLDDDGTLLRTDAVDYNTVPVYNGLTPQKPSDAQYTYTFIGWTPEIAAATEDATYTAQYSHAVRTFTVTWVNYDGTVLETDTMLHYGDMPSYDGETPVKPQDELYSYTFSGWSPSITAVSYDVTYTATFSNGEVHYAIRWLDEDGTLLRTDYLSHGDLPEYGTPPSKESDGTYVYTFNGWSPEIVRVEGDAEYVATYEKSKITNTFVWKNYDGSLLAVTSVEIGETPVYPGEQPHRNATLTRHFSFAGWDPVPASINTSSTFTAVFDAQDHIWAEGETSEATCTSGAAVEYTCTACGYKKTETVSESLEHVWGEWFVVTDSTNDELGLERRYCSVCNAMEQRPLDELAEGTQTTPVRKRAKIFDWIIGLIHKLFDLVSKLAKK